MSETINDRMETLVNEMFAGNKSAFAKAIDLQPTAISSYLSRQRRSKPSVDMVAKIVMRLNVDARWLLTGEGEALKPGNTATAAGEGSIAVSGNNNKHLIAGGDSALLQERVEHLEELLMEKERLIKVLMEGRK